MSHNTNIDIHAVRRAADALRRTADDLHDKRKNLLTRLANGAGERPIEKTKDNIMVTVGVNDHTHSLGHAGEVLVDKIKSCGDSYLAAEEGIRAMSAVMSKMADELGNQDNLSADDLNHVVDGLFSVQVLAPGASPESIDWFGLGQK
jgi:hypothetical protein